MALLSVADAQASVLKDAHPLPAEDVPLGQAHGADVETRVQLVQRQLRRAAADVEGERRGGQLGAGRDAALMPQHSNRCATSGMAGLSPSGSTVYPTRSKFQIRRGMRKFTPLRLPQ